MEDNGAVAELLVASLQTLEDRLGHVDVVGIGLKVPMSTGELMVTPRERRYSR